MYRYFKFSHFKHLVGMIINVKLDIYVQDATNLNNAAQFKITAII
jgi:hypothetical protein